MGRFGGSSYYTFANDGFAQYEVKGFAAFPDSSLTEGTSESSPWASKGGYVDIANSSEGGSDHWGVFLVQNNNSNYSLSPWLAVMSIGSDAWNKTSPNFGSGSDLQYWYQGWIKQNIVVDRDPLPPVNIVADSLYPSSIPFPYLKCRRVMLASIDWNGTNNAWDVKQEAIGTITIPQNITFVGAIEHDPDVSPSAPWDGWPLNYGANNDWDGSWIGYDKMLTTDQTEIVA
jgi:hypothetical protein